MSRDLQLSLLTRSSSASTADSEIGLQVPTAHESKYSKVISEYAGGLSIPPLCAVVLFHCVSFMSLMSFERKTESTQNH